MTRSELLTYIPMAFERFVRSKTTTDSTANTPTTSYTPTPARARVADATLLASPTSFQKQANTVSQSIPTTSGAVSETWTGRSEKKRCSSDAVKSKCATDGVVVSIATIEIFRSR